MLFTASSMSDICSSISGWTSEFGGVQLVLLVKGTFSELGHFLKW